MNKELKLAAVIPAAGLGSRIGMPKWQLKFNGLYFLEIITKKLQSSNIHNIYCTYRLNSKPTIDGINYIINKTPDDGMFSSIYYASKIISGFDGILIWPVDHPFISTKTLSKLIKYHTNNPKKSCKPSFNGKGGHPIILSKFDFDLIKNSIPGYNGGLRKFLKDNSISFIHLDCIDSKVLKNINTIDDF